MDQMRAAVANLYSGEGWKQRVAKMPEAQILAIYNRQILNKAGGKGKGAK